MRDTLNSAALQGTRLLQNFLSKVIFSDGQCFSVQRKAVMLGAMMTTELEAKAEKYESKAAQCREWAEKAKEGPQRTLYEVLADYYAGLATDFRVVITKRQQVPAYFNPFQSGW